MKIQGVYKITNIINGKMYIGSSNDVRRRLREHKNDLKNNNHGNEYLQNSYNKYGSNSFDYSIIEIIDNSQMLIEREIYWIKSFNSMDKNVGYNMCLPSLDGGTGERSQEVIEKLRLAAFNYNHKNEGIDYDEWRNKLILKKLNKIECIKKDMTIYVFNKDTGERLFEFKNTKDASESLGIKYKIINQILSCSKYKSNGTFKVRKSYNGYVFVYKRNFNENKNYTVVKDKTSDKKVQITTLDGTIVGEFKNVVTAAKELGVPEHSIYGCVNGNIKTVCRKYIAKYT